MESDIPERKMIYTILFSRAVRKELYRLPRSVFLRVQTTLASLRKDPFPSGHKKLEGYDLYRLRIGNYRIVYEVTTKIRIIVIIRIGHRKDIYRTL